ncbi:MAG: asparagine synthase (glutamine-hydrolyzing) [Alphaproteobacteria bacterium]
MCGIAAIVTNSEEDLSERIGAMLRTLVHRGPDDEGIEVMPEDGVALGVRRLSIVDVEHGHQPMWDEGRRFVAVFNGESYNAPALRRELEDLGHRFASDHSDTETIVHGFEQWGEALVPKLNGMFAFAVWDRRLRRLFVARDRVGEKPLYFCRLPGGYAVASEPKALLTHPALDRALDLVALDQHLSFRFSLPPRTIVRDVHKLPAGSCAFVDAERIEIRSYWRYRSRPQAWQWPELLEALDEALSRAVESRLAADVPIGIFLSSGLDSNTVAYYAKRHREEVDAYTIAFAGAHEDERPAAKLAMDRLGVRLHTALISDADVLAAFTRYVDVLDEHVGMASGLPIYLVSAMASAQVKVALCGEGSDELLMGYRQFVAAAFYRAAGRLPLSLRRGLAALGRGLPESEGLGRSKRILECLPMPASHRLLSGMGNSATARSVFTPEVRAQLPTSVFDGADTVLSNLHDGTVLPEDEAIAAYVGAFLPENMLLRLDRASMANSVEVRSPFLDPDLVDLLATVPASMKLHRGTGKHVLRRLMRGRIPDEIMDHPKRQFIPPFTSWLRGVLKPLVLEYVTPQRMREGGIFDPRAVEATVRQLMEHGRHADTVWTILVLEMWRERWSSR